MKKRILIIGAVAAGTSAAAKARRNDEDAEIVVYERDDLVSWSGCGLPYWIGGAVEDLEELIPRDAAYFRSRYGVDMRVRHEVTAIDPVAKTVTVRRLEHEPGKSAQTTSRTLPVKPADVPADEAVTEEEASMDLFFDHYDTLILATGANPVVPPIPGVDLPQVHVLRNPHDAQAIRASLRAAEASGQSGEAAPRGEESQTVSLRSVVIGSGFIGLEMAESLVASGVSTTIVEMLPTMCPMLDPDMGARLAAHLEKQGVAIRTGVKATGFTPAHNHSVLDMQAESAVTVDLDNGEQLPADLVILAVGVRPNTKLAASIGAKLGVAGAIVVDERMRTSVPDVYACGDCVQTWSVVDGQPFYRPLGSTANKTGRICGDVVTGGDLAFRGIAGTGIFRVLGLSVAATGMKEQEARDKGHDVIVSHNIKPDRPAYMGGREMTIKTIADRSDGKLLGVQILGFDGVDKRMDVFVTAITCGMKVQDLFHLDLAYAPPFSTTKDPVMYSGMILDNAIRRGRELVRAEELLENERTVSDIHPKDFEMGDAGTDNAGAEYAGTGNRGNTAPAVRTKGTLQIVDARSPKQYDAGHADGAVNIPQDKLRESSDALDRDRPVVVYCNKGTTGNAVQNLLLNRGFRQVRNLSGGYSQYKQLKKQK